MDLNLIPPSRPAWKRFALAALVTAAAALVRVVHAWVVPDVAVPFVVFYLAIAVSVAYGGLGPGLLSWALSCLAGWYSLLAAVGAGHTRITITTVGVNGGLVLALAHFMTSARRRAERALDEARAQREQFENVLERVSDAFITLDREFRITYVNHEAARINAKPARDMIGRTHWEEWPRSVGSRVEQVYRQVIADRKPARFEHLYSEPPVHHVWLEIEVYPAQDGGLAIFYRDITARKQAEQQLESAHRQIAEHAQDLQALLDVAPVGIALAHDPDCRVITSSIGMATMLGTSPDANISKSRPDPEALPFRVFSVEGGEIAPDDLPMQLAARTRRLVSNFEYVIAFEDGRRRNWLVNAAPLFNDDGAVRGAVGVHIDITARKQAEEALRLALERLDAHFDNSPIGVVEWDADYHVTRWSNGAERILGWSAQETIGKRIDDFPMVHEDDWDSVGTVMRDMTENVRPRNMNRNRNRRKDGTVVTCEWYNSAIFDAGRLVSILSQVVDVTAREDAERERTRLLALAETAREQAERANAAKDDFLAMLSHELRAPMQSVLGWVRVLERSPLDHELLARAVRTIERNARQQSQLINDMLDVSRIVAGKLSIEPGETNLSSLVEQTVEELAPEIHAKGLAISTAITPVLLVLADHERMHQVLLNVIGNAVKFTPVGGRVTVACAAAGPEAVVTVRDTGIGIAPDLLTEIFDRFRQGDTSSTRRHEGLGLGLSIARHIVEQHGGAITAESAGIGTGATFAIHLPLLQQPATATASPMLGTDLDLAGVDVLVVDDHPDTLELLEFVLKTSGATARGAASVRQALALFRARQPDIVITDVSMPDEDGFDFLRAIRTREHSAVPAVALTGLADASNRARALASGFDAHLAKPVEPHVLVATIRDLLRDGHAQRSPAAPSAT